MNSTTGIFNASVAGKYFFSLSGMARFPGPSIQRFYIGLYMNGNRIGRAYSDENIKETVQYEPFSLQSTLNLKAGDVVWIQIEPEAFTGVDLYGSHYVHFTGWLLEEDIF